MSLLTHFYLSTINFAVLHNTSPADRLLRDLAPVCCTPATDAKLDDAL
jgi:hypothetical protein